MYCLLAWIYPILATVFPNYKNWILFQEYGLLNISPFPALATYLCHLWITNYLAQYPTPKMLDTPTVMKRSGWSSQGWRSLLYVQFSFTSGITYVWWQSAAMQAGNYDDSHWECLSFSIPPNKLTLLLLLFSFPHLFDLHKKWAAKPMDLALQNQSTRLTQKEARNITLQTAAASLNAEDKTELVHTWQSLGLSLCVRKSRWAKADRDVPAWKKTRLFYSSTC